MLAGIVLAVQANFYRVSLDRPVDTEFGTVSELLCTRRTRLKKIGTEVYVGDRVVVEEPDWQGRRGAIAEVLPRHRLIDRPKLANPDRALLVFSLATPAIEPLQVSRFLVKVASVGLEAAVCLNKVDLVEGAVWEAWRDRLRGWGYDPIALSVTQQTGIEAVRARLGHGITVVAGPSGVGKSSLIATLIPGLSLRVGGVSEKLGYGRHTTRHVELFPIGDRGLLADTPGFAQPQIACPSRHLAACFPEVQQQMRERRCRFDNCWHRHEPECVVRGEWERYEHYLLFLEEILARESIDRAISTPDAATKALSSRGGDVRQEPRLLKKRHRRLSRRTSHQNLECLYDIDDGGE